MSHFVPSETADLPPGFEKGQESSDTSKQHMEVSDAVLAGDDDRVEYIKSKVDLRLFTILALMYIVNQIDQTNLPNAVIAGMGADLDFKGSSYSIIVLVFFPTYILFNFVATVLVRTLWL